MPQKGGICPQSKNTPRSSYPVEVGRNAIEIREEPWGVNSIASQLREQLRSIRLINNNPFQCDNFRRVVAPQTFERQIRRTMDREEASLANDPWYDTAWSEDPDFVELQRIRSSCLGRFAERFHEFGSMNYGWPAGPGITPSPKSMRRLAGLWSSRAVESPAHDVVRLQSNPIQNGVKGAKILGGPSLPRFESGELVRHVRKTACLRSRLRTRVGLSTKDPILVIRRKASMEFCEAGNRTVRHGHSLAHRGDCSDIALSSPPSFRNFLTCPGSQAISSISSAAPPPPFLPYFC